MNNFIPKNRVMKMMIIVACVSVLVYVATIIFLYSKIRKVEDFYYNSGSESFKQQKYLAIKPIFEKNKESIEILRSVFIRKNDEVNFINQLEDLAKVSGIQFEIDNIDTNKKDGSNFENLKIKMNIQGKWGNVIGFVYKLEKMPLGVLIENVGIDNLSGGNWSGSVDFSVFREI